MPACDVHTGHNRMEPDLHIPSVAPSDEDVVAQVLTGERDKFELLVQRHSPRVYRAACAIVHDASEAEDVVQDACARAYEHLGEFEGRARFSTWFTRIAVHEALARVRRGKRFPPREMRAEDSAMSTRSSLSPEQQTSDVEIRRALEAAVAKLPDHLRTVFVLRAVEEMSGAETAECLGIREETVKTRLHRARSRLQETLIESVEPSLPALSKSLHASDCGARVLFDHSPLPMWVYDVDTLTFVAVNDAAVRQYGYRREEFGALTLEDIRPQEDLPALRDDVARHTDGGRVWRHCRKDGSTLSVEVKARDFEFKKKAGRLVVATERLRSTSASA